MNIDSLAFTTGHKLYLGQAPGYPNFGKRSRQQYLIARDLLDLQDANPDVIVVLLPEEELAQRYFRMDLIREYEDLGFEVIHFPIDDFGVPSDMRVFANLITLLLRKLKSQDILIHCAAGQGRTGLIVAGLLIRLGLSTVDALKKVRKIRPSAVEDTEQVIFLRKYERLLWKR